MLRAGHKRHCRSEWTDSPCPMGVHNLFTRFQKVVTDAHVRLHELTTGYATLPSAVTGGAGP
jgi:hypothetical protein